jgi:hypothetical protein
MTTYNWSISGVSSKASHNGQSNVIDAIGYIITGNDGTHETTVSSIVNIDYTGGDFVPFESLTEATVITWAQHATGEARIAELHTAIDENLARIAAVAAAPVSTFHSGNTLPWTSA